MQIFSLFPTCVTSTIYEDHEKLKKVFFQNFKNHVPESGYPLGEASGHVSIHNDPDMAFFFKFVSDTAREYLKILGVDESIWEVNLVKTWLNSFSFNSVPPHNHADAHLTWIYYMNVPEGKAHPLVLLKNNAVNDLTNGLFENDTTHNQFSASRLEHTPTEGELMFLPSNLDHQTALLEKNSPEIHFPTNDHKIHMHNRISISGDIVLTFKETSKRSRGLQPVSNWKKF